ncbi:hypothetical protein AB6D11_06325 [Vibrio splendidus]
MSDAIERLKQYCYDPESVMLTHADFIALKPLSTSSKKNNVTLYRGINCPNVNQHQQRLDEFSRHQWSQGKRLTSFSKDLDTARHYATCSPSYFPNDERVAAELEREARCDWMSGHSGFILKATYRSEDCLKVSDITTSSEQEFLVLNSARPISVSWETVYPYYHEISRSRAPVKFWLDDAIESKNSSLMLHIVCAWGHQLSEHDRPQVSRALRELTPDDQLTLIALGPTALCHDIEVIKGITSLSTWKELAANQHVSHDLITNGLKEWVNNYGLSTATVETMDFLQWHAINDGQLMDAVSERLADGRKLDAISLLSAYSIVHPQLDSLFKEALFAHRKILDEYIQRHPIQSTDPIQSNDVEGYQFYHHVVHRSSIDEHRLALFRYSDFYSSENGEPTSLGCMMEGHGPLFKLMARYDDLSPWCQTQARCVMDAVITAAERIQGASTPFPGFNPETLTTLTRYPATPQRCEVIDVLQNGLSRSIHKTLANLKQSNQKYESERVCQELNRQLGELARCMSPHN